MEKRVLENDNGNRFIQYAFGTLEDEEATGGSADADEEPDAAGSADGVN